MCREQKSDVRTHRGDGKRFVVRADEKLTVFLEVEAAIWVGGAAKVTMALLFRSNLQWRSVRFFG